jgi:hypothetical protein
MSIMNKDWVDEDIERQTLVLKATLHYNAPSDKLLIETAQLVALIAQRLTTPREIE